MVASVPSTTSSAKQAWKIPATAILTALLPQARLSRRAPLPQPNLLPATQNRNNLKRSISRRAKTLFTSSNYRWKNSMLEQQENWSSQGKSAAGPVMEPVDREWKLDANCALDRPFSDQVRLERRWILQRRISAMKENSILQRKISIGFFRTALQWVPRRGTHLSFERQMRWLQGKTNNFRKEGSRYCRSCWKRERNAAQIQRRGGSSSGNKRGRCYCNPRWKVASCFRKKR